MVELVKEVFEGNFLCNQEEFHCRESFNIVDLFCSAGGLILKYLISATKEGQFAQSEDQIAGG